MKPVLFQRGKIPFYFHKTPMEFRRDAYEQYDPMVIRQTALHLADELWQTYPFQAILDWTFNQLPTTGVPSSIADIGCGVGRWIGEMAQRFPESECVGIDYSYQMLKRASEYWVEAKTLELDWSRRGFEPLQIRRPGLKNLSFGLACAGELPFADLSLDLIFSGFLFDRLDDPGKVLEEILRVLHPDGRWLMISPLNFQKAGHWEKWFPAEKLVAKMEHAGFKILACKKDWRLAEPMDRNGNKIEWKCLGIMAARS